MPQIKTKCCIKCNKVKSLTDFHKNRRSKDGVQEVCKECYKIYHKDYLQRLKNIYKKGSDVDTQNSRVGIDSWQQVDSVLRAMAESQIAIDKEQAVCDKRIGLIKKYSEENIEPYLTHKMGLETMLTNFLKAELSGIKTSVRKFLFGQIFLNKGRVTIKLNTELANRRIGKP